MDAKIIIYLLLAVGLMGGSYGIFYSEDLDEAKRQLSLIETQLKSTDTSMERATTRLKTRKEAAVLVAQVEALGKEQDALKKEIADLQLQQTQALEATLEAVKKVRASAVGEVIPELTLINGKNLKKARIQSVDEGLMVVMHAEGIAKIQAQELPKEFHERLLFGILAKKPEVEEEPPAPPTPTIQPKGGLTKAATVRPITPAPKGNIRIEGDPALWSDVTRRSLGRVFVPGKGWLVVGTKGPIPPMKDYP